MVIVTVAQALEALDGVFQFHLHAVAKAKKMAADAA